VDVTWNLDQFPWPWPDQSAAEIHAEDIYEHVDHPLEFMGECWRILQPGGLLRIRTGYWKGESSYTDPTHKRFLTERSFDYWIPGTFYYERYGAAYARGASFRQRKRPIVTGDNLLIQLERI
jgi:SAM-dependent methyltransferase